MSIAAGGNPPGMHPFQYQASHPAQQTLLHYRVPPIIEDRSIVSAAGGMAVLSGHAHIEKLPSETGAFRSLALSLESNLIGQYSETF
jgi:chromatin structure-remodeling complex subunit RSC1/2